MANLYQLSRGFPLDPSFLTCTFGKVPSGSRRLSSYRITRMATGRLADIMKEAASRRKNASKNANENEKPIEQHKGLVVTFIYS
jgi:hypothetical protein